MAKVKLFAVTVEEVRTHVVYVEARRPGGAEEKVASEEGWREAVRYDYDDELPPYFDAKRMRVTDVRQA